MRSRTLIDNIFSNCANPHIRSGNLTSTISDHLPQFFIYPNMNKTFIPRKHNIYKRNVNDYDKRQFLTDFSKINWDNIINVNNNNTNVSFNSFYSEFNNLLDTHVPLKK